jgi:hypothetical protein
MLVALDYSLARRKQIVIAGSPDAFLKTLNQRFQPYAVTIVVNDAARLAPLIPAIEQMKELDGRPTAYVCENFACQLPTHDVSKFDELLK